MPAVTTNLVSAQDDSAVGVEILLANGRRTILRAVTFLNADGTPGTIGGGGGSGGTQADTKVSGTIDLTALNATFDIDVAPGQSAAGLMISGLAGGAVITPEASYDGVNFVTSPVVLVGSKTTTATISGNGQYRFNVTARRKFRFRVSTEGTGTANVVATVSVAGFDAPAPTLNIAGATTTSVDDGSNVTQGNTNDAAYAGVGAATVVALLKGSYAALIAPTPAGNNNIGTVNAVGNVASGAADSGNPVKIGGVASGSNPVGVAAGQRTNLWSGLQGQAVVALGTGIAVGSGVGTGVTLALQPNGNSFPLGVANYVYDGTNSVPARGDANGTYVGGNVASGAADSGNPVKIGGIVSPTGMGLLAAGQRVDASSDFYGNLRVRLVGSPAATPIDTGTTSVGFAAANSNVAAQPLPANMLGYYWNAVTSTTNPARGDTTGIWMGGHANINSGQANVGTTASLIVAARTGRQKVTLNPTTSTVFYVGGSAVTAANGFFVAAGQSLVVETAAAIYGVAGAAIVVSYLEQF